MDDRVAAAWQQIAVQIGHEVRCRVNTSETIGTQDETGYVLMFFNADHHDGKSTIVSSCKDVDELKKLLETALRNIPRAKLIEPGSKQ